MPRAVNLLRASILYRKEAFTAGLQAAGYDVVTRVDKPGPGDVLVIWNRYGGNHEIASAWEQRGAAIVVVENGLLGKSWRGGHWFSLALGHHSGAGEWKPSGPVRWDSWKVELKPWRDFGSETIIFEQRGIGEPGVASPFNWANNVQSLYGGRIRRHPGKETPDITLYDDLRLAKLCITWHSAAAFQALMLGIPVWCDYPNWVGVSACQRLGDDFSNANTDDVSRLNMFRSLAWHIWTLEEVSSGQPFKHLLG